MLQIADVNRIAEYVNHIRVVPNAFDRQRISRERFDVGILEVWIRGRCTAVIATYLQAVGLIALEAIATEQRSAIDVQRIDAIDHSGHATRVALQSVVHRVVIDGDRVAGVGGKLIVDKDVVDENRL